MFSYCFGFCITFDLAGITGVQYILDTVSQELLNNPQRRFIYVEMAFFTRWWNELHDSTRQLIKGLVSTGNTLYKTIHSRSKTCLNHMSRGIPESRTNRCQEVYLGHLVLTRVGDHSD